jgi:membrane associated rhomboid family serine protease
MAGIGKELMDTYKNGGILIKLIFINSIIFILGGLIGLFYGNVEYWLSMPSDWQELIYKPWTIITYNFYHKGLLHFFLNILNLYWFGKIFLIYFNDKKLLSLYLLGGIVGGALYFIVYNAFPSKFPISILMGASASIMAIIIAAAVYAPNFKVYMVFLGEVKLIYIGLFSFILSLILINSENAGGNIAHVGGAIFGYLWVKQYQRGVEITGWFARILDFFGSLFKRRKMKVVHKQPPRDELEYNHQKNVNQKEIDRILDKISKAGYDSLTKSEKETLFHLSNKND